MRIDWIFAGGGETKEFTFEHRLFSAVELASLLRRAGFSSVDTYGNLEGKPYDIQLRASLPSASAPSDAMEGPTRSALRRGSGGGETTAGCLRRYRAASVAAPDGDSSVSCNWLARFCKSSSLARNSGV